MKYLGIVGSRDYPNAWQRVSKFVDALPPRVCVVSGGADGPDKFAEERARERGLWVMVKDAVWRPGGVFDPRAGFDRNADLVLFLAGVGGAGVAFWDGKSRGTADTIDKMRQVGRPLWIVRPTDPLPRSAVKWCFRG